MREWEYIMARIEKTVFISYRRKDISWALAVYQYLASQKYDVFFDYTHIPSGDFEQIIIGNIKARAHFVLILTPTALDRCTEPGDWLRREIETAIDEKRNIIPLFFDGFSFGSPNVKEKMTGKMANISRYNGLEIPSGYFPEAMERLSTRYLNIPLNSVIHPVSIEVRKVVNEEKNAANKALREQKRDIEELVIPVEEKPEKQKGSRDKDFSVFFSSRRKVIVDRFSSWIKNANLRRYVLAIGVLLLMALGIIGINSLNQKASSEVNQTLAIGSATDTFVDTLAPKVTNSATSTDVFEKSTPSQTPTIFPSFTYNVVGGDSCLSIAIQFDVSLQSIKDVNQELDCNSLFIGQVLGIPYPTPTPNENSSPEALGIGSTLVSSIDGMVMVYVPAGQFAMGSDDRYNSEPRHIVVLDKYWIDQVEITNAMFAQFVEDTGYLTKAEETGSSNVLGRIYEGADWMHPYGAGSSNVEDNPVVHISWDDALAYCTWAERRLPTEAEWEKAASWNDLEKQKYDFPWGNEFVCGNGVFSCNGYTKPAPVGQFLAGASPYGALDMAGNVSEWVSSLAKSYPYSSTDGREDLLEDGRRVVRGSSWGGGDYYSNPVYRDTYPRPGYNLGFRCAMDAE
ncbi:MAG TPA: SUMF1/EgtB/PvdO family nonheme iron enzyme [Anaerolineales bacterium]